MADSNFLKDAEHNALVGLDYLEAFLRAGSGDNNLLYMAQDKFDTAAKCVQCARVDIEAAQHDREFLADKDFVAEEEKSHG